VGGYPEEFSNGDAPWYLTFSQKKSKELTIDVEKNGFGFTVADDYGGGHGFCR
jgi:hypothetical protein